MAVNAVPKDILLKRAVLLDRADALEGEKRKLLDDIEALDRAALIFDPTYTPQTVGKRPKAQARKPSSMLPASELTAIIGKLIRSASEPMTTSAIAAAVADAKGLAADDKRKADALVQRVRTILNGLERTKVVEGIRTDGDKRVLWRAPLRQVG
ncbi:MAG TPA: hypothetical protein VKQ29_04455 [Aliidongia sp.]|nr:hypothetical protein [Aliidongia sp.]